MKITPFISNRIYPTNFKGYSKTNKFPEEEKYPNKNIFNGNFKNKINEANKDTFTKENSTKTEANSQSYSDLIFGRIFLY